MFASRVMKQATKLEVHVAGKRFIHETPTPPPSSQSWPRSPWWESDNLFYAMAFTTAAIIFCPRSECSNGDNTEQLVINILRQAKAEGRKVNIQVAKDTDETDKME